MDRLFVGLENFTAAVNPHWAMPSIAFFVTWKQMGFYILVYLAALQNVGKELYEAAATDGASRLQELFACDGAGRAAGDGAGPAASQ